MRKLTRRGLLGRLLGVPAAVAVGVLGVGASDAGPFMLDGVEIVKDPALCDPPRRCCTWTGWESSEWHGPRNWSGGVVPVDGDDVWILPAKHHPIAPSGTTINDLTIWDGSVFEIEDRGACLTADGGRIHIIEEATT